MAGFTYATLTTAIQNYTEVGTSVLTSTITDQFIMDAEYRLAADVPIDADRNVQEGSLALDDNTINVPAECLFVRGVEVFNSASVTTGPGVWLIRRDQTFLSEYVNRLTGPEGSSTGQDVTGFPKYYSMFGGATGVSDTTSGGLYIAPTPDLAYKFRIYYNKFPQALSSGNTATYISQYFPQGLLYACLVEAYGFLKGPMDMLTLYENKYKQEVQKFAATQLGRRRRDDYTDGTIRIPIESPNQ
mgnify:CR=1 FL=1|jgi:hypothetical protein|tara:strand:- start:1559 stop:2290 length:732 start_codon:yes stop_codon:yes gene_type:complete